MSEQISSGFQLNTVHTLFISDILVQNYESNLISTSDWNEIKDDLLENYPVHKVLIHNQMKRLAFDEYCLNTLEKWVNTEGQEATFAKLLQVFRNKRLLNVEEQLREHQELIQHFGSRNDSTIGTREEREELCETYKAERDSLKSEPPLNQVQENGDFEGVEFVGTANSLEEEESNEELQKLKALLEAQIRIYGENHASVIQTKLDIIQLSGDRNEIDRERESIVGQPPRNIPSKLDSKIMEEKKAREAELLEEAVELETLIELTYWWQDIKRVLQTKPSGYFYKLENITKFILITLQNSSAIEIFTELLHLQRDLYGASHTTTLITESITNKLLTDHALGFLLFEDDGVDQSDIKAKLQLFLEGSEKLLGQLKGALVEGHRITTNIMKNIANIWRVQGRLDDALAMLNDILEIQSLIHLEDERHISILLVKERIASVLMEKKDFDGALENYTEVSKGITSISRLVRGSTLFIIGALQFEKGMFDEGVKSSKEACTILRDDEDNTRSLSSTLRLAIALFLAEHLGKEGRSTELIPVYEELSTSDDGGINFICKNEIANLLVTKGNYEEALKVFDEVYTIVKENTGETNIKTVEYKERFANLLIEQKQYSLGLKLLEEVREIKEKTLSKEDKGMLGTRIQIGHCLQCLGRDREALEVYLDIQQIQEQCLGEDSWSLVGTKYLIALTHFSLGNLKEALELSKCIWEKSVNKDGKTSQFTRTVWLLMASGIGSLGDYDEALEHLKELQEIEFQMADDLFPVSIELEMANWLCLNGKYEEAMALNTKILSKSTRLFGEKHYTTQLIAHNIGEVLSEQGYFKEALAVFQKICSDKEDVLEICMEKRFMAEQLSKLGRKVEALALLKEIFEKVKAKKPENYPETLIIKYLTAVNMPDEEVEDAKRLLEDTYAEQVVKLGEYHMDTLRTKKGLAMITVRESGGKVKAIEILGEVLEGQKIGLGKEHPETVRTRKELEELIKKKDEVENTDTPQDEVQQSDDNATNGDQVEETQSRRDKSCCIVM